MLDKKEFTDWLKQQTPNKVVGKTGLASQCPLANWLRVTTGKAIYVYHNWYLSGSETPQNLPEWACEFVELVDARRPNGVTCKTALRLLEQE